jgi:hypothetical protein
MCIRRLEAVAAQMSSNVTSRPEKTSLPNTTTRSTRSWKPAKVWRPPVIRAVALV